MKAPSESALDAHQGGADLHWPTDWSYPRPTNWKNGRRASAMPSNCRPGEGGNTRSSRPCNCRPMST